MYIEGLILIIFYYLDSWVELSGGVTPPVESQLVYGGNLEKLLIEAQRESRSSSRPNSKESSARGRFVLTAYNQQLYFVILPLAHIIPLTCFIKKTWYQNEYDLAWAYDQLPDNHRHASSDCIEIERKGLQLSALDHSF